MAMFAFPVRSAMVAGQGVLSTGFVVAGTDVALTISSFIAVEVIEPLFAAAWERAVVAVMRVLAIVHVSVETVVAVEPRSGAKEHAADEPVGAVIPVGGTVVRSVIKVPVRTNGRSADTH